MNKVLIAALAAAVCLPAAAQHAAHEHGVAALRVAVDGSRLLIELESPLENLVGFEHAPATDRQRAALAAAEQRLRRGDTLFVTPAAAGCVLHEVDLESPHPQTGSPAAHDHGHDDGHDHERTEGGHSDMHVTYIFECADPAALTSLRVTLGEAFPGMRRILAETATPAGQGKVTLDKSRRALPL